MVRTVLAILTRVLIALSILFIVFCGIRIGKGHWDKYTAIKDYRSSGASFGDPYHTQNIKDKDTYIRETYSWAVPRILVSGLILIIIIKIHNANEYFIAHSKCKKCKKMYAMVYKGEKCIEDKDISVVVENETRSEYDGRITARTQQHIPGKRKSYLITYVCKYCGDERRDSKTIEFPLK